MLFPAIYSIAVGLFMMGTWILFLVTGEATEFEHKMTALVFYWTAEFITAISLIVAGTGLLYRRTWASPVYLIATGMLLYTLVYSPSWFVTHGHWPMVAIFAGLLILGIIGLGLFLRHRATRSIG